MRFVLTTLSAAAAFFLVVAPGLALADVEVALILSIDGNAVEGENPEITLERENTIKVLSFSNAVSVPLDAGTGQAVGTRLYKPITITKPVDKSTPLLYKALTNNEPVTSAEFRFFRAAQGGGEEHYYTVLIENGFVSAVSGAGGTNADVPTEMVSFVFQDITWTYEDGGVTHTDTWSGGGS